MPVMHGADCNLRSSIISYKIAGVLYCNRNAIKMLLWQAFRLKLSAVINTSGTPENEIHVICSSKR